MGIFLALPSTSRLLRGVCTLRRILTAAALAFVAANAHAIHKCTDAKGKVSYSDKPCESGVQARVIISDNTATMLTPAERDGRGSESGERPIERRSTSSAAAQRTASKPASTGTGESVKVGDTRRDVERKRGNPKNKDATYFDQNCNGLQDTYRYPARNQGDLAQTIYFCDDRVVDVKHDQVASETASNGTGEAVRVGDTRLDVERKRGLPQKPKKTSFDGDCNGRQDIYQYPPREDGDLAQTIYLCDNRVVNIKHTR
jgi:hypothetical protein